MLRALMMWVGFEGDEALFVQVVDDALHVLAICSHVASKPRYRLWVLGRSDGAEDLPAGTRKPKPCDQPIACRREKAAEPK